MLDGLVGKTVLLQYIGAKMPSPELIDQMIEDTNVVSKANPQVISQFVILEAYDHAGIVVEDLTEEPSQFFVSWGVISQIHGADLES